jgi:YggT family protein
MMGTAFSVFSITSPVLADVDPAVQTLLVAKPALDILFNSMSVLFLARIIMSWYPKTDIKKFPYNAIVWPTEPLMIPARELLPPAFGVDISAIFWLGLLSFIREVLTGQQGILTLMEST